MPQLPVIIPRIPLEVPNFASRAPVYEAAGKAYDALANLYEGSARTEAAKSIAEGGAELNAITQGNADSIVEPQAFSEKNSQDIENAFRTRIEAARTPRARQLIEAGLADEIIKARAKTKHIGHLKTLDVMNADFIEAEDKLRQKAVGGTPQEQEAAATEYGKLLAVQVASGAKKIDDAAKLKVEFKRKVAADSMNIAAAGQPTSFYERFQAGEFRNNDPVDVQRALDIAEKSQRARDEKVRKDTAWASREAERMYIAAAERHQLDVNELEQAAEFYQWSDEKVDKIRQMQAGLRESSPDAQKLIADALDPIIKPDPSIADINRAAQNLIRLSDKVSPDSREYRGAMDKVRNLLRSTRITNDIQANQAERRERRAITDAKRDFSQLMNQYEPRLKTDRRRQKLGEAFNQIEAMTPDQARAFVEKKRQEYETKKKNPSETEVGFDILQGLRK